MTRKEEGLSRSLYKESRHLSLMTVPVLVWYGLFCYLPLFGIAFAFKSFTPKPGQSLLKNLFVNSRWAGFQNFSYLFRNPQSAAILLNTLFYNVIFLIAGIAIPVFLAVVLTEVHQKRFQGLVQMTMVLPYFLSWVIVSYCVYGFLSTDHGQINAVLLPIYPHGILHRGLSGNASLRLHASTGISQLRSDHRGRHGTGPGRHETLSPAAQVV